MVVVRIKRQVSKGHVRIDMVVAVDGYSLDVPVEVLQSGEHGVCELVEDAHEYHGIILAFPVQALPVREAEVSGQGMQTNLVDVGHVSSIDKTFHGMRRGGNRYSSLADLDHLVEHHWVIKELCSYNQQWPL